MNNFMKIITMMLVVLMMCSLAACGERMPNAIVNSDTVEPSNSTDETVEDLVSTEDTDSFNKEEEQQGADAVVFKENLGRAVGTVSVGDNFGAYYNEEHMYGEMFFDDNACGNAVVARMRRLDSCNEVTDVWVEISLEWEQAGDEIIYENVTAKVLRCTLDEGNTICACWIDEDAGLIYGLAVVGDTLEFEPYLMEIFYPNN